MASKITSWLSSAAATSELNALTEIQGINDFPSNRTTASVNPSNTQEPLEGIDWNRLRDFERPPPAAKRQRQTSSHIWDYGWRLHKRIDGLDYWVCRLCHTGPAKPRTAAKSSYVCNQATTSAASYLERVHSIRRDGNMIARTAPSTPSSHSQSILESYCSAASERNTAIEAFDVEVFRGLLTRFFAVEQVPLVKVDSLSLRELLIYLNPRCRAALPGRTTLKRYLSTAYEHALPAVKAELASARTKINLSFDFWTSPNRRLSLLGVVAHYLDRRFTPRSILLGLPRMTGSHTAASLSE